MTAIMMDEEIKLDGMTTIPDIFIEFLYISIQLPFAFSYACMTVSLFRENSSMSFAYHDINHRPTCVWYNVKLCNHYLLIWRIAQSSPSMYSHFPLFPSCNGNLWMKTYSRHESFLPATECICKTVISLSMMRHICYMAVLIEIDRSTKCQGSKHNDF